MQMGKRPPDADYPALPALAQVKLREIRAAGGVAQVAGLRDQVRAPPASPAPLAAVGGGGRGGGGRVVNGLSPLRPRCPMDPEESGSSARSRPHAGPGRRG